MQRFRIFLSVLLAALVACAAADARERKKKKDEDAQKSEEKTATDGKTTTGEKTAPEEPAGKTEAATPVPIDEPKEDKAEKPKKQPKASGGGLSAPLPEDWEAVDGGEMELRNRKIEAHVIARLLPSKGAESPREWLREYLGQVRKKKRGGSILGEIEAKKAGDRRFVFVTLNAGDADDRLRQRIYVAESGTPGQYLVLVASAPPGKMAAARKDFDEILDTLEER